MDPDRARELLAAERRRIEGQLAELARSDADGDEEGDSGDQAAELYQDELDESRSEDLHEQLAAVERAEDRLAAGTYGLSLESGLPIPDERLEAIPTAELTVEEERAGGGLHGRDS
jgi:DnaK suppressor protein